MRWSNIFPSFDELMISLQDEISINKFSANFSSSAFEKQFYSTFARIF